MREFLREPEAVFWVFVFPMLLAFALGIAFRNTAPEKIRVGVESNEARSSSVMTPNARASSNAPATSNTTGTANASAPTNASVMPNASNASELSSASSIMSALSRSADIEPQLLSSSDAAQALRGGKVSLIVRPEASGFAYRFDPTRPESRMARMTVDDALQRAKGRTDTLSARDEQVTETGSRYIDFLIPGLVGLNLLGSGMWGLGFAVVTARGRKLLKRFAATPMRRRHYLFSFMLSRLLFLSLEVIAILGFAWLAFGVTVHGSLLSVAVISIVGGLTFSALGMLVAARPTTIEGVSGLMNFAMLPMWLLSGTFFSSARFPPALQPFIKALPLTAFNDALRSVMSEGAPLSANWLPLVIMLAWCLVSFVVALRIFRWQ
jgi:ABC-type multidrug transport system permease subunit